MSTTERIRRLIKEADELLKQLGTAACVALALSLTACGGDASPGLILTDVDGSKPGVLIVGDSISLGYTPYVRAALYAYSVSHTPANNMGSANGRRVIDTILSQRPVWSVVVFNHGAWDIPARDGTSAPQAVSVTEYAANLQVIGAKMLLKADRVVFVTTTEVSAPFTGFSNADVAAYNAAAVQVMGELGIEVLDLNAVSAGITGLHSDGIHWTDAGSAVLSQAIVNHLGL